MTPALSLAQRRYRNAPVGTKLWRLKELREAMLRQLQAENAARKRRAA